MSDVVKHFVDSLGSDSPVVLLIHDSSDLLESDQLFLPMNQIGFLILAPGFLGTFDVSLVLEVSWETDVTH